MGNTHFHLHLPHQHQHKQHHHSFFPSHHEATAADIPTSPLHKIELDVKKFTPTTVTNVLKYLADYEKIRMREVSVTWYNMVKYCFDDELYWKQRVRELYNSLFHADLQDEKFNEDWRRAIWNRNIDLLLFDHAKTEKQVKHFASMMLDDAPTQIQATWLRCYRLLFFVKLSKFYRVIAIGDKSTGKSKLIECLGIEEASKEHPKTTHFFVRSIPVKYFKLPSLKTLNLQLWDSEGFVEKTYYIGAQVCLVCFDITNLQSFEKLESFWMKQVTTYLIHKHHKALIVLVGLKADLASKRQVSVQQATEFAKKYSTRYFEVCTTEKHNLQELLLFIGDHLLYTDF